MALDFPNTPTLNQVFTAPNGAMWMWDGAKWTAIASVSQYAANTNVGRNLIHNPLFNVAQRGAGPFAPGGYTLDRWALINNADTCSITQAVMVDAQRAQIGDEAAAYAATNTFTGNAAGGAYNALWQPIEGLRRLSGKTVTLSFWAACGSGTPKLGINYYQAHGTGGTPSTDGWNNTTGQSVTLSTTWTRYSVTTTIASDTGKTLGTNNNNYTALYFIYSSGATNNVLFGSIGVQSGTVSLWGVQLEVGSVATPLEKPDPRYDLSNCQRFYQLASVYGTMTATAVGQYVTAPGKFAVQMHHAPTLAAAVNIFADTNVNAFVADFATTDGFRTTCTAAAAGISAFAKIITCTADL